MRITEPMDKNIIDIKTMTSFLIFKLCVILTTGLRVTSHCCMWHVLSIERELIDFTCLPLVTVIDGGLFWLHNVQFVVVCNENGFDIAVKVLLDAGVVGVDVVCTFITRS